ncbi:hypothetical protein MLD38_014486 [Melastoma candidum]|uniref:Uncharacterized protein n=1 Tax=Melastoma candidum TaxID=119954 RepID=A0ACB9RE38_9MYRT|nr:hypothetical protein MLD38_014486 [Melastoma candidum]
MMGNLHTGLLIIIGCIVLSSRLSVNSFTPTPGRQSPEEVDKLEAVYKTSIKLEARSYQQNNRTNRLEEAVKVKRGRAVNGAPSDLLRTRPKSHSDGYSNLLRHSSFLGARISHVALALLTLLL